MSSQMSDLVETHMGKVCDTCGDIGVVGALVTCTQCKVGCQHLYCMSKFYMVVPADWCCEMCRSTNLGSSDCGSKKVSSEDVTCYLSTKLPHYPKEFTDRKNFCKSAQGNWHEKAFGGGKTKYLWTNEVKNVPSGEKKGEPTRVGLVSSKPCKSVASDHNMGQIDPKNIIHADSSYKSNPKFGPPKYSEQITRSGNTSRRRENKRLKPLNLPKTSYDNPLKLDKEINDSETTVVVRDGRALIQDDTDDDNFVNPSPRNEDKMVTVTAKGTGRESMSKQAYDIPKLMHDEISPKEFQKKKSVKHRAHRHKSDNEDKEEGKKKRRKCNVKSRFIDEETDKDEPYDPKITYIKTMAETDSHKDKQDWKAPKANITDQFKIRNSPKTLSDMVSALSDRQIEWVRRNGFGHLLDFRLDKIPHRLASSVLNAFDATKCSLELGCGCIQITQQDVHDVLGLPIGERILTVARGNAATDRENMWKQQFLKTNITTSNVLERMRRGEDDDLFKMNFLMVLGNVLIERQTGSYVHRELLSFDIHLDECNHYNWGEYLLRCLVKTKTKYRTSTSSLFFTGPIIFLLIFYVDRVIYKAHQQVERHFPAFKGWTSTHLKKRQVYEVKYGDFGTGLITTRWRGQIEEEKDANDSIVYGADEELETRNQERDGNETFASVGQQDNEVREKEWFESLSVKAVMLMDAFEIFQAELEIAKTKHPNDNNISDIEDKVMKMIQKMKQSQGEINCSVLKADDICQGEMGKTETDMQAC